MKLLGTKTVYVDDYTFYLIDFYEQDHENNCVFTNSGRKVRLQTVCDIMRYHCNPNKTDDKTKDVKTYTGVSSCSFDDEPNPFMGKALAFNRAVDKIGNNEHHAKLCNAYIDDKEFNSINWWVDKQLAEETVSQSQLDDDLSFGFTITFGPDNTIDIAPLF